MAIINNKFDPDYAVHPGEYLEEILESREIKKRDFAQRSGLSVKAVSQIINKKSLYSPETALMFEKTLGVKAEIWMNLADSFQLLEAKENERRTLENEKTRNWLKQFPLSDLKKLKIIPDTRKTEILADSLLRFLEVSSPDVWDEYNLAKAVSYRKCCKFRESEQATAVWLKIAEKKAAAINTENFEKTLFRESLDKIREVTYQNTAKFIPIMSELCRKSGVALVLVPELKETHISGASMWISQGKAMIALSLRYKTNDHFWFTFFHEAAHLLFHGKKNVYIDLRDERSELKEEKDADYFASNILIPQERYNDFIKNKLFYPDDIMEFAKAVNIHPGIVAGRLQHDGLIQHNWHNSLKEKDIKILLHA